MRLKSNMDFTYKVGGVHHVRPGINEIREDIAARMVATEDFKSKVKSGLLEVKTPLDEGKAAELSLRKGVMRNEASPLEFVHASKAGRAIEGITDLRELVKIIDLDKRAEVGRLASNRLWALLPDVDPNSREGVLEDIRCGKQVAG